LKKRHKSIALVIDAADEIMQILIIALKLAAAAAFPIHCFHEKVKLIACCRLFPVC